jgi:GTPase SAR1 family protein
MTSCILIKRNELQQQIDLRNHYLGEAAKRKDADADILQSSTDEKELFVMFTQRALNELTSAVALRFSNISYNITEEEIQITFETTNEKRSHLLPSLKQAITDYLANEIIMQWLLLRQPMLAQPLMATKHSLSENIRQIFAKFYNNTPVRRRATDLAGI